ncbi:MAG: hypothetical protein H7329_19750 [Opitutaceae bacterium]|nr:hypothetical protein [Cytophagales bacterium]
MNKSGIKLTSFKNFLNKYFIYHSDGIVLNTYIDVLSDFSDPRVSFLELNIENGNNRKDWLHYSYYPYLGTSLNLKIKEENTTFGYLYNN